MRSYFSHGKLLLTGEYLVLEGAKALAVPTIYGQEMQVNMLPGSGNLHWTAKDSAGNIWLNFSFILEVDHLISVSVGNYNSSQEVVVLKRILENALAIAPDFLNNETDYEITTLLQFPNNWGLGSSSTLIANIAQWAGIDAIKLFFASFEGSGYDIAVALESKAIVYVLENKRPEWKIVDFNPPFKDQLYFIHLGIKQNSRDEITAYKKRPKPTPDQIETINKITDQIINCNNLPSFESLVTAHENLVGTILETSPIKERLFPDYTSAIKSLGAWGGDFILATGNNAKAYFSEKGYNNILGWNEIVKG